jgi:hypothetical protein
VTDVLKREQKSFGILGALEASRKLASEPAIAVQHSGGRVLHNALWRESSFIGKYGALFGHASAFLGRMLGILGAALYIL